jgi:hypothetical protein
MSKEVLVFNLPGLLRGPEKGYTLSTGRGRTVSPSLPYMRKCKAVFLWIFLLI